MNTYHLYYWSGPEKVGRRMHIIEDVSDEAARAVAAAYLKALGVDTSEATLLKVLPVQL